jgi:hypothetical protein
MRGSRGWVGKDNKEACLKEKSDTRRDEICTSGCFASVQMSPHLYRVVS